MSKLFKPHLLLCIYEMPGVIIRPLPHSQVVSLKNCLVNTGKSSAQRHYSTHVSSNIITAPEVQRVTLPGQSFLTNVFCCRCCRPCSGSAEKEGTLGGDQVHLRSDLPRLPLEFGCTRFVFRSQTDTSAFPKSKEGNCTGRSQWCAAL